MQQHTITIRRQKYASFNSKFIAQLNELTPSFPEKKEIDLCYLPPSLWLFAGGCLCLFTGSLWPFAGGWLVMCDCLWSLPVLVTIVLSF